MSKKKEIKEPKYLPSPLANKMINYKVYYMSASEKILYFLITFVLGGLVGNVFYGGLFKYEGEATMATYISNTVIFVIVGLIAAKVFLPTINENLKEKRAKRLTKQFTDMLEGLSASLSAGNTVNDAFINAKTDLLNQYSESDYIVVELNEIISGLHNGKTLEEMIYAFGKRSNNEDIENFANVMSNCYRLGGNFRDVVRKTRNIISDKFAISDEINTKIASNKLQLNAMSIMPIALVALLKMMNESFAENLASPIGIIVTTLAVATLVGAYRWGKKIIDIR